MNLQTAEGYADLKMWRESWQTLDAMHPLEKGSEAALRVRLRCCGPLGVWAIGEHVANLLRDGDAEDRNEAASFFLDYARTHPEQARSSIAAARETWPACEAEISRDPLLSGYVSVS
jgi:hypothetical protein